MSAEENRKLVLMFCRYLSERKLDPMFALLSEDSNWSAVGQPETFKYGGPKTKSRSVEFISAFLNAFKDFRFDVQSSTADGDRVAIEATSRGTGAKGNIYENQYLLIFRCRDGLIINIREFFDQMAVLTYEKKEF